MNYQCEICGEIILSQADADVKTNADRAFDAFYRGDEAEGLRLAKELIEEITGRGLP